MKITRISMILIALTALTSCVSRQRVKEENQAVEVPNCIYHQVKYQGETLAAIAQWYTGDFNNWHAIIDANEGLSEKRVAIGANLCIPYRLVIKQEPFPKPKVHAASVQAAPVVKEEPKKVVEEDNIFVPKDIPTVMPTVVPTATPTPEPTPEEKPVVNEKPVKEVEVKVTPPIVEEIELLPKRVPSKTIKKPASAPTVEEAESVRDKLLEEMLSDEFEG